MTEPLGWLLDTNVISELRKSETADQNVASWAAMTSRTDNYISVVTIVEIRLGIELLAIGTRRARLEQWLETDVREWFGNRILAADESVLLVWRKLVLAGQKSGLMYSNPDGLIAATAIVHGLTVVTRNTRDFEQAGVPLLNPWLVPA